MRRTELKRKTGLRANPDVTREFVARGRGKLKSDPETQRAFIERARKAGLSRDPIKIEEFRRRRRIDDDSSKRIVSAAQRDGEGPLSPKEWRVAVATAADLRCIVTGTRADDPFDPLFDAHHPLPKRELRARGLRAFVYDPRNGVFVSHDVHMQHEYAHKPSQRISRALLPAAVWEFCRQLDELAGHEWATAMVERTHPAAGLAAARTRRTA